MNLNTLFLDCLDTLHDKFKSWRRLAIVLDLEISTIYKWRIKVNEPNILTKIGLIAFAEANNCVDAGKLKEIINEMDCQYSRRFNCN